MEKIMISGFSDEISSDFDEQLKVVTGLGMEYISLRTADGKSIADYTAKGVKEKLLPKLKEAGVRVSSLGSPIGKVEIGDEEGFAKQLVQLEELCRIAKVLDCRYIRIFSFYIPEGRNPEDYREAVIEKLIKFNAVARTYGVVLIHENEKGIYGDGKERCRVILDALGSDHLRQSLILPTLCSVERTLWSAGSFSMTRLFISTLRMPWHRIKKMCSAGPAKEKLKRFWRELSEKKDMRAS